MRYSQAFIPTVKEVPKDATTPSHILMLRSGLARMVGAGIYELLPLGTRVLRKVSAIIRDEMDAAGAQELTMPTLLPAEYYKETGRWDLYGATLFRLKDRKDGDYHLAPTHEEIITDLVRREVKSYRKLPVNLYQIQWKYRDEPRPRAGLLRCREFLMKDAYSFDVSEEKALESYAIMRDAYHKIFGRLGLAYRIVEADTGAMGGKTSAEFQVLAQTGEDSIVACGNCDYAANVEIAELFSEPVEAADSASFGELNSVPTPDVHSIEEVVAFFKDITPAQTLKSLVYLAGDDPVLAVVRGDHEVNEIKLARHLGVDEVHLATEAAVRKLAGAGAGSVGPVGFKGRVVADHAVAGTRDAVCGANQEGHHYRGVNLGRDFDAELASLRLATDGDACPKCGSPLKVYRGIEGGHIFVLGTHYSGKMNATFLDEDGNAKPFVMGCYGIGVTRLIAAIIEQHHDDNGIRWPVAVAPFHVMITAIGKEDEIFDKAGEIYDALRARGVEVLFDDRKERPGVKFKDADLLGIPVRLTVGGRGLKEGVVEFKKRADDPVSSDGEKPEATKVPVDDAVAHTVAALSELGLTLG